MTTRLVTGLYWTGDAMVVTVAVGMGILLLAQAGGGAPAGRSDKRVATGAWGGRHVALTVTDAGARLEFDCAAGEISEALTIDSSGRLAVDGVFIRERPGAQRVGEEPARQPARYTGKLDGDTLTLDVTLKESNQSVGSYTVTRGNEARLFKCR